MEDEAIRESIEASAYLEGLADQVSDSVENMMAKSIDGIKEEFVDRLQNQQGFNNRLAKAIIAQGNLTAKLAKRYRQLVEKLSDIPDVSRGRTVLTKSDVDDRPFDNQENNAPSGMLTHDQYQQTVRQLWNLVEAKKIDPNVIIAFENDKSLNVLPKKCGHSLKLA